MYSGNSQTVAVYGNVMNWQNVTKWYCEFPEGRTDVHDKQRAVGHLSSLVTFFRKLKEKLAQINT